jgi:hypothetical protein
MESHIVENYVIPELKNAFNEDICRGILEYIDVKQSTYSMYGCETELFADDYFPTSFIELRRIAFKVTLDIISNEKGLNPREHTPFIKITGNREYKNGTQKITFKNPIYSYTDIKMKIEMIISNDRKKINYHFHWERIPQKSKNPRFEPTPYF